MEKMPDTYRLHQRGSVWYYLRRVVSTLAGLLALSGCGDHRIDGKVEASSACEVTLKHNLLSKDSLKTGGNWTYSEVGQHGLVQRDYEAVNGFGVKLSNRYLCSYDLTAHRVDGLEVNGPTGRQVIVQSTAVLTPTANAREDALKAGAERARTSIAEDAVARRSGEKPPANLAGKWIVNIGFSGCPAASDWFPMQDAMLKGDMSVNLPPQCHRIAEGTVIRAGDHGMREKVMHNGHDYEMAALEDGRIFWTDSMDDLSLSRHK